MKVFLDDERAAPEGGGYWHWANPVACARMLAGVAAVERLTLATRRAMSHCSGH